MHKDIIFNTLSKKNTSTLEEYAKELMLYSGYRASISSIHRLFQNENITRKKLYYKKVNVGIKY